MQWLPSMKALHLDIIVTGKDVISPDADVVIISYDMASKKTAELQERRFKAVILVRMLIC